MQRKESERGVIPDNEKKKERDGNPVRDRKSVEEDRFYGSLRLEEEVDGHPRQRSVDHQQPMEEAFEMQVEGENEISFSYRHQPNELKKEHVEVVDSSSMQTNSEEVEENEFETAQESDLLGEVDEICNEETEDVLRNWSKDHADEEGAREFFVSLEEESKVAWFE